MPGVGHGILQSRQFGRGDGVDGEIGMAGPKGGDARRALGLFQRTDGIDQRAAWPCQFRGIIEQLVLQPGRAGDVAGLAAAGDVGMAADGAGGAARRIQQHGVERFGREAAAIGGNAFGRETGA